VTKQPSIAAEIAAHSVLAMAIGLFVSIVLAGITMLLAA
jgi:tetrahydromethanopterin S-methyltransferase subunit F